MRKGLTCGSPEGISTREAAFSVVTLACVNLIHKNSQYRDGVIFVSIKTCFVSENMIILEKVSWTGEKKVCFV